jgi:hypothetical protein
LKAVAYLSVRPQQGPTRIPKLSWYSQKDRPSQSLRVTE